MKNFISIFLLVFFVNPVTSCTSLKKKSVQHQGLDQYLSVLAQKEKAMGEVAIITKGKVVYQKNYGFKKQELDSIFRVGSISKVYTAVLIMKEVERGLLTLDTKLSLFYPNIPNSKEITIEHLLMHRSGLVNFTSRPSYIDIFSFHQSEASLIEIFIKNGVDFKPGKNYNYSNTGYVLLSLILEKLHRKPFSSILDDEIVNPLKLEKTYVYEKENPRKQEVISYEYNEFWKESSNTHESVPMGAGAIVATPQELGMFLWSLFNGKVLKPSTVEKMKMMVDSYGLGLFSVEYNGLLGFGHTGGIDSFVSIGFHFADIDTVVVNLTNALAMKMNDISLAILASVYGDEITLPVFEDVIKLSVDKLQLYEGLYKSEGYPLDIKIFVKDDSLFAQATGQGEFRLDAVREDTFVFNPAVIRIVFKSKFNELHITQGGSTTVLKRN